MWPLWLRLGFLKDLAAVSIDADLNVALQIIDGMGEPTPTVLEENVVPLAAARSSEGLRQLCLSMQISTYTLSRFEELQKTTQQDSNWVGGSQNPFPVSVDCSNFRPDKRWR